MISGIGGDLIKLRIAIETRFLDTLFLGILLEDLQLPYISAIHSNHAVVLEYDVFKPHRSFPLLRLTEEGYIHDNPVRHQLGRTPADWSFSSVHRFIAQGLYPQNRAETNLDMSVKGCLSDL